MSFWDRYLAPGDIRRSQQALDQQHLKAETQAIQSTISTRVPEQPARLDPATRARRQDGLLYGGILFSILSVLVTRRAVARKMLHDAPIAAQGIASTAKARPMKPGDGLDAVEALSFATLNVFSFGIMAAGAIAKIFDVADLEDLRQGVRRGIGFDVYGGDAQADKELEEWVSENIIGKDGSGLKEGLAQKLVALEKLTKEKMEQTKK